MFHFKKQQLLIFIVIISIWSCSSNLIDEESSLKSRLARGLDYLDDERYQQAKDEFNFILMRGAGTELGDDAQYFLGESYYLNKEYIFAIEEYSKLVRNMGYSPFAEKARFRICESYTKSSPDYYNDQSYTEKAIIRYQEFVDDYPETEHLNSALTSIKVLRNKLAKKIYETGILYIKMDEFIPARMSFNQLVDDFYDTNIIEDTHFQIIRSFCLEGNLSKAKDHLKTHSSLIKTESINISINDIIDKSEKKIDKIPK